MLGVPEGSDRAAVTAAYRKKALCAHPDRGGAVGEWLEVQRAYRQLVAADEPEPLAETPQTAGSRGTGWI